MPSDDVARELVVVTILHDELDLIARAEPIDVGPFDFVGLAACRALHVHHFDNATRDAADVDLAARLEQHSSPALEQPLHQRIHIVLQQRFPAGDLDQGALETIHLPQDIIDRHLAPFVERVGGVAPRAPQIAPGEAYEHARAAGVGGLALDRIENLVDAQHNIPFYRLQSRTVSKLRIGTSGWNYPSGRGTWNGIFYPPAAEGRRPKGTGRPKFDELAYYAEHFDTVEINTTFYGQPKASVAHSWAERTPADFEFSLKLYRELTHSAAATIPPLNIPAIDEYRAGIEPLAQRRQDWRTAGAISAQLQAE